MSAIMNRYRPQLEPLESRWLPSNNANLVPPALNSLPGATAAIYLDFNGHFDPVWRVHKNVNTPPFDLDGKPNSYSAKEVAAMKEIWRYVAEDYAPFNINVTTVEPRSLAKRVALRVAVGGSNTWFGSPAGGVAWSVGAFTSGLGDSPTAFVFAADYWGNTKNIGLACSHEAGHMLGLAHQSQYDSSGTRLAEYYAGPADGTAPLMGVAWDAPRSLWWFGTSSIGAGSFQNDMTVIGRPVNRFGFRKDDHGNQATTATLLAGKGPAAVNISQSGLISRIADKDWFRFVARPGPVTFTVNVPVPYNNLDAKIALRDSAGNVLAVADPADSFAASINFTLTKGGTYYVVVSPHGFSSAATSTSYGFDVGTYRLTGRFLPGG